jgi:hypothetical protein
MSSSVQEYIDKHDLSKKVEEAINSTVKSKPEEPLAFLVRGQTLRCVKFNCLRRFCSGLCGGTGFRGATELGQPTFSDRFTK